jgi:hypothetical protein
VNRCRSPPRTRRSSASSVSSGGGLPVSTRNRSRSPSASLQAPRSNCEGSSTVLDSLNVNSGRRSITPTRSRSPTPRLSVTKAPSSYGGSNSGLNTSGRTSRNRSRSPTPRSPSRNKNACISSADSNNNNNDNSEGGDAANKTAPPDPQSLNDSGSEVSDEGYRSLGVVATCAVDGTAAKAGHEELGKPEEGVQPEDAQLSGTYRNSCFRCDLSRILLSVTWEFCGLACRLFNNHVSSRGSCVFRNLGDTDSSSYHCGCTCIRWSIIFRWYKIACHQFQIRVRLGRKMGLITVPQNLPNTHHSFVFESNFQQLLEGSCTKRKHWCVVNYWIQNDKEFYPKWLCEPF